MDPITMLAMGGLQGLGSLISGFGRRQSARNMANQEIWAKATYNDQLLRLAKQTHKRAKAAAQVPVTTTGNLQALVADAERSGFNPLTVLRSGGLSYYNSVTGASAMQAALAGSDIQAMRVPVFSSTQVPSTAEVVGDSVQSALNSFSSSIGTAQQQAHETNLAMLNRPVSAAAGTVYDSNGMIDSSGSGPLMGPGSAGVLGGGAGGWASLLSGVYQDFISRGGPLFGTQRSAPDGVSMGKVIGVVESDPTVSKAEVVQQNWGEGWDWLWGLYKPFADLRYTIGKHYPQGWLATESGQKLLQSVPPPTAIGQQIGNWARQTFWNDLDALGQWFKATPAGRSLR